MGITISILLTTTLFITYKLNFEERHIDWRDKLFHYMATFIFWIYGASPKKQFSRSIGSTIESYPGPGEKSGVASKDLLIPHYLEVKSVKIRLYETPSKIQDTLLIFIHGGGFVLGLSKTYDETCRYFCANGMSVISIDYSLAPENPWPAAVHDCYSVLGWVKKNFLKHKIVIGGDSAGGNLSAVMCAMNRDSKLDLPISLQVLIYPTFFCVASDGKDYHVLSSDARDFFFSAYVKDTKEVESVLLNPMKSKDGLKNLPKCILITAEYDVLNQDANMWEKQMNEDGGTVVRLHYPTVHGFFCVRFLKYARVARRAVLKEIHNVTSIVPTI
jgi:acetyl esterase